MKPKQIKIIIRKDEHNDGYVICHPLSPKDRDLRKKAEQFEKETGLPVYKPTAKFIGFLPEEFYEFLELPQRKRAYKTYLINIKEVRNG